MEHSLGDQELEVLNFIFDNGPISVRDVTERFGVNIGLARTTVQTVMERLRKKGFLTRTSRDGIFEYEAALKRQTLVHELIQNFVKTKLRGSLSPFVAYLTEGKGLTPDELEQLHRLVEKLEAGK